MEHLENRNDIRIQNQIQIFEFLRKEKRTITEIATFLNVSFTAASNIVDELVKEGYLNVVEVKKEDKNKGRTPVYIELNLNRGVICVIDLYTRLIKVNICTLDCEVIAQRKMDSVIITQDVFENIEASIREMLVSPEVKGLPLLSICIASPGLIRPDTYEYAKVFRIPDYLKLNPVLYFKNAFNVRVEMHNDVRVACLAELKFGSFPESPFNGMFLHIGFGTGLTFIFNGKIYTGSNGFAGEAPSYAEIDKYSNDCWNGRLFNVGDICKKVIDAKNLKMQTEDYDVDELARQYNENDKDVVEAVDLSCRLNALSIIAYSSMLDFDCIIIEGKITKLGEPYFKNLRKYIAEYSKLEIRAQIIPSSIKEDNAALGASYIGVSNYYLKEIQKLARKRLSQPDFKVNKGFKEF